MTPERIPQVPPSIASIAVAGQRPLWSVMIPTYNCYAYLQQTLLSVLQQDPGSDKMQIEVIDDFSTDGEVEKLVTEIGQGRVGFYRQPQNLGSLRNFETCIKRSRGELIHILHGDDLVVQGFYTEIDALFNNNPSIGAAFTGLSSIDETGAVLYPNNIVQEEPGVIEGWLMKISRAQYLRTSAIVVKRKVYEQLGGFFAVHYGEDWEMFVRIAANFPVAYSPKNLALYRLHTNNISTRSLATGENIRDIRKVIDIIQAYVPIEKRREIKRDARRAFAHYFSSNAQGIYKKHKDGRVALAQAKGALLLHFDKRTFISVVLLCAKIVLDFGSKSHTHRDSPRLQ